MRLHKRTILVNEAARELEGFVLDVLYKKYKLTFGEMFALFGEQVSRAAKYAIRSERHGDDSDKRGDEE